MEEDGNILNRFWIEIWKEGTTPNNLFKAGLLTEPGPAGMDCEEALQQTTPLGFVNTETLSARYCPKGTFWELYIRNVPLLGERKDILEVIIMLAVNLVIGIFSVKIGMDNSRNNQQMKEMIEELREIKEILRDRNWLWFK